MRKRSAISTILIAQFIVTVVLSAGLLIQGRDLAASAFIGGMICVIPNVYLARRLTARRTADPNELTRIIYTAEFGKIIITAALFAGVFATQEWIQPIALLVGFGLVQLTHWLTPVVVANLK
ncbi:MAG: ATP synthase subunit I [Pseudomonadota bacterium]